MKRESLCAFLLMMFIAAPSLFGTPTTYTMGYTPAGGVSVGSSGTIPSAVPTLYSYTGFNSSAYQTLYYGVNYVANVGAPGTMAFQGYNPTTGILAWGSTANWSWVGTTCGYTGATQLIMQVQPFTGSAGFLPSAFLNGDTTTKSVLGITTGNLNDPLFQVVGGGSFQQTFEFETWDGTPSGLANGQDLADLYNGCSGGVNGQYTTSVDFEFWWSVQKTASKTVQVGTCKTNLPNYATIQTAVNAVPSGATVEVCPGTYNEQISINAPITLEGISSGTNEAVVLNPPGVFEQNGTIGPYPVFAQIIVQDSSPVNISGLTIDGNNSGCPSGALVGIAFLSTTNPASGKITNSVIRNVGNGCSPGADVGIYAQNESGSPSTLTIQSNSIHSISGGPGVIFGPNMSGTITLNTISQTNTGLMFQQAGPNVRATGNSISSTQNAINLNDASGVTAQTNTLVATSGNAISLQDNTGGGNNVTKNTINETNCGISTSGAAGTDVYLPNTVLNASMTTCH